MLDHVGPVPAPLNYRDTDDVRVMLSACMELYLTRLLIVEQICSVLLSTQVYSKDPRISSTHTIHTAVLKDYGRRLLSDPYTICLQQYKGYAIVLKIGGKGGRR